MKSKDQKNAPITTPLLKDLMARQKAASALQKQILQKPSIGELPLQPAEFDQDSGGGYNLDNTFPQE